MLSHLRFHRRGAPNPPPLNAPQPVPLTPLSSRELPFPPALASPPPPLPSLPSPYSASQSRLSSSSARPPLEESHFGLDHRSKSFDPASGHDLPTPLTPWTPATPDMGFIGGAALQTQRRGLEMHHQASSFRSSDPLLRHLGDSLDDSTRHSRPSISAASATYGDSHKTKRSLPFLKNPMSALLMRRRNNLQNAAPEPLARPTSRCHHASAPGPGYDPCIRGTRVHDFSAPRSHSRSISSNSARPARPASRLDGLPAVSDDASPTASSEYLDAKPISPRQSTSPSPSFPETMPVKPAEFTDFLPHFSWVQKRYPTLEQSLASVVGPSLDQSAPPVPPKDDLPPSAPQPSPAPQPQAPSPFSQEDDLSKTLSTSPSPSPSHHPPLPEQLSALPRHMKSTSSRFSFDMAGAAKQEKILEEKHRQRELEKRSIDAGPSDSRFDDFDEAAFDYDAMLDDDGLEEKIPGVNADLELDHSQQHDPDNDQENFSGFVFQRSNPVAFGADSNNAPAVIIPRDAQGNFIPLSAAGGARLHLNVKVPSPNPQRFHPSSVPAGPALGLGIREPRAQSSTESPQSPKEMDDWYFDDGMIDWDFIEDLAGGFNEAEGAPFDESIFDSEDTDQFGRPLPGAFAMAQSRRVAAHRASVRRESDMTSWLSAQSGLSPSTAHTSLSVDVRNDEKNLDPVMSSLESGELVDGEQGSMAAYQAALAAAAHKAVASGKFQRSNSPSRNLGMSRLEGLGLEAAGRKEALDETTTGGGYDDTEQADDDAIIAEANASALANDSEGWYSREFGFFPLPASQFQGSHSLGGSSNASDYEYANGGFFGPKGTDGLDNSIGGRAISRAPNLTPITERSEYSNRNSVLSLGFPGPSSSTPIIQSPGLAQLAMMADRGDDSMTLSALLRLRTKAWGGSQASLASREDGSPRLERVDASASSLASYSAGSDPLAYGGSHGGGGKNMAYLAATDVDSDAASASGSPALTMAGPVRVPVTMAASIPKSATE